MQNNLGGQSGGTHGVKGNIGLNVNNIFEC
jgi:hypothetical protein